MNDLETLQEAWGRPLPPSHAAFTKARAALLERAASPIPGPGPAPAPAPKRRLRLPRLGVRLVAVGAMAVTIAAGVTVAQNLGGVDEDGKPRRVVPGLPAGPVANAQDLLNRAAGAAEVKVFAGPRNDQWTYVESLDRYPVGAHGAAVQTPRMRLAKRLNREWMRADGKQRASVEKGKVVVSDTGGMVTTPPSDYPSLAALPRDPDVLLAWIYKEMGGLGDSAEGRYSTAYSMLSAILRTSVLPPPQETAIYRALAKIPGVRLNPKAVDVAGRPALAVGRMAEGWLSQEILLDRTTYRYIGERSRAIKDHTATGSDGTWTVKKGTIQLLSIRTKDGIVDQPGQRP